MADLAFLKGFQFFDSSGDPLNGGLIRIYDAGTTNTRTVYKDDGAGTSWSQPITLTSAGRLTDSIYVPAGDWKFALTTAADTGFATPIISEDNIPGAVATADASFARPQTPVITKGANYTVTTDDIGSLFVADATGGAFTLTLPAASSVTDGQGIRVQQVGTGGAVTLAPDGSDTINGAATLVLRPQYGWVDLMSDGADWIALPARLPFTLPAAKTSAYTVTAADDGRLIRGDATSAGFTITLLAAATAGSAFRVGIKKIDSSANAVTVDGNSTETIDGAANHVLGSQYETVWLICDGSNWHIESRLDDTTTTRTVAITFIIGSGLSTITTGVAGDLYIPFACTLTGAYALADQSGSIVVDIWEDVIANYPPTDADSITASAPVTITTATNSSDTTLTGWTTALVAGSILRYNVDSVTSHEQVTVTLTAVKTA
jgi:hypothetical protein